MSEAVAGANSAAEIDVFDETQDWDRPAQPRIAVVDLSAPSGDQTSIGAPDGTAVSPEDMAIAEENRRKDFGTRVLDAWTAVETLTPIPFRNIEDMAPLGRDDAQVVPLAEKAADGSLLLAWDSPKRFTGDPKLSSGYIGHQIIFGTLDMDVAATRIANTFGGEVERNSPSGLTPLATIQLDEEGKIVPRIGLELSSFPWAMSKIVDNDFESLANWPDVQQFLIKQFYNTVAKPYVGTGKSRSAGSSGRPSRLTGAKVGADTQALTAVGIRAIYAWLSSQFGVARLNEGATPMVQPPLYAVAYHKLKKVRKFDRTIKDYKMTSPFQKPIDSILLNSFYLDDLARVRDKVLEGNTSPLLDYYLGINKDPLPEPIDLLKDRDALREIVSPANCPAGVWPVPGHHPMVVMQQAAINVAASSVLGTRTDALQSPITAINGPPGTGKTAFAKDYAAAMVVARASAMCRFDHPDQAFKPLTSSWMVNRPGRAELAHYGMSALDPSLTGFEILVASNNNAAVENISAEWPSVDSVAEESGLNYLPGLAEKLHERPCWGAISASLGNRGKRTRFKNRAWFDDHHGLKNHFSVVQGRKIYKYLKDGGREELVPALIKDHDVPRTGYDARVRWTLARRDFTALNAQWLRMREASEARYQATSKATFDDSSYDDLHRSSVSFTAEENKLREDLFKAAIGVHKAFLDAAANRLEPNLSAAMSVLDGEWPEDEETRKALVQSLFLVFPVLSTSFASVRNMLGGAPDECIGTLIVDEAGQATPQSAVGAFRVSKRALVLGDPVQVEPVVTLPRALAKQISLTYGVDPGTIMAPAASVQTLSDCSGIYGSAFPSSAGPRFVGLPLVVHRRCDRLQFDICNEIAYGGLMVFGTPDRPTCKIETILGPSRWIDVVEGGTNTKWSEKEGEAVIRLLEDVIAKGGSLDEVFIISPFRDVARGMIRTVYRNQEKLKLAGKSRVIVEGEDAPLTPLEKFTRRNIGTVHTVQGREADAVIFVLGSQGPNRQGARNWAGRSPNILNVAVSRSKRWITVVGSRSDWSSAGCFRILENALNAPAPGDKIPSAPTDRGGPAPAGLTLPAQEPSTPEPGSDAHDRSRQSNPSARRPAKP